MEISLNPPVPEPKPVPGATITLTPQELVLLHVILRKATFDSVHNGLRNGYRLVADRVGLSEITMSGARILVTEMSDQISKAVRG